MDINTFRYTIADMVSNKISRIYKDYNISLGYSYDINRKTPAILIQDGMGIVKYSIDRFYKNYMEDSRNLDAIVSHIFTLYYSRRSNQISINVPNVDDIFVMVGSSSINRELMNEVPHHVINEDLTAFYRVKVVKNGETYHETLTYEMLHKIIPPITEQELFEKVKLNTIANMPFIFTEQYIKYDPDNAHYIFIEGQYSDTGANIFLFPELLKDVAEKENGNLLIAPIGRNLIRLGSESFFDKRSFDRYLTEENSRVDMKDYLSSQVYLYQKDTNMIVRISDKPMSDIDNCDNLKKERRR